MAVVSETPPGRRASGQCSDTLSDFSDDSLDLGGRNGPAGEALFSAKYEMFGKMVMQENRNMLTHALRPPWKTKPNASA